MVTKIPEENPDNGNWKGYVVKHNYVNYDVLMTILDNYMFRPLLAIFRLSSRECKDLKGPKHIVV